MEQILPYIRTEYAVLVAALYCLGRIFKSIRRFPNHLIPLALTVCGVALACLSALSRRAEYGNPAALLFDGVVQGVLCTGMAVYAHELLAHCARGGCCCGKDRGCCGKDGGC